MPWKEVVGKEQAVRILRQALVNDHVAHAYLLIGKPGVGKEYLARLFAQTLNCKEEEENACGRCTSCIKILHDNHPDIMTVHPQGKTFKIEQIRGLQKAMGYSAFEAKYKVYIICEVEKMTLEAANSLLKVLEEPPKGVVFILTAIHTEGILPTILSRCQLVYVQDISFGAMTQFLQKQNPEWSSEKVHLTAILAGGNIEKAQVLGQYSDLEIERDSYFELFEKIVFSKEHFLFKTAAEWEKAKEILPDILELLCTWYRDIMIYKITNNADVLLNIDQLQRIKKVSSLYTVEQLVQMIDSVNEAGKKLQRNGNAQLVLEVMLLGLSQIGKREKAGVG